MSDFYISPQTRAQYRPGNGALNISMDFNAAPSGTARGTEVIIPDNASPEVRAAAERYNAMVAEFAAANGIQGYPVRGVRTRSENGRGVNDTIHVEPFFNSDVEFQNLVKANPAAFAEIYRAAFGSLPNARLIAPHGVGRDRGAASEIFGDETSYGEFIANTLLGNPASIRGGQPLAAPASYTGQQAPAPQMAGQPPQNALSVLSGQPVAPQEQQNALAGPQMVDTRQNVANFLTQQPQQQRSYSDFVRNYLGSA